MSFAAGIIVGHMLASSRRNQEYFFETPALTSSVDEEKTEAETMLKVIIQKFEADPTLLEVYKEKRATANHLRKGGLTKWLVELAGIDIALPKNRRFHGSWATSLVIQELNYRIKHGLHKELRLSTDLFSGM